MATGADSYIEAAVVTRVIVSPNFQAYLSSLSNNPSDSGSLSKITTDCVRAIKNFSSIDFALNVKTFYDADLFWKVAGKLQQTTARDVVSYWEGNTLSIYIKPRQREIPELVVLDVVEGIIRILFRFLFPDSNDATISYYTVLIMFEKIFSIVLSDKEKENVLVKLQNKFKQFVEEIPELVRKTSLTCPYCQSQSIELLGLQNKGTVEYKAGVPVLSGKKEDIVVMAYYKCGKCQRVFYAQPEKMFG